MKKQNSQRQTKTFLNIPDDKWKHIIVGTLMGILFPLAMFYFFPPVNVLPYVFSFIAIIIIGYGFELFSFFSGLGTYDVMDAVATACGGIIGLGVSLAATAVF